MVALRTIPEVPMSRLSDILSRRSVGRTVTPPSGGQPHPLDELAPGADATVVRVDERIAPATARRLFDLGFVPGATVTRIRRAPLGGPSVYRVAGYEIALRTEQARTITVCPTPARP